MSKSRFNLDIVLVDFPYDKVFDSWRRELNIDGMELKVEFNQSWV